MIGKVIKTTVCNEEKILRRMKVGRLLIIIKIISGYVIETLVYVRQ